jgi:hypothetical protein
VAVLIAIMSLLMTRMFYLASYPYPPFASETVAYGLAQPPVSHRVLAPRLARGAFEWTGFSQFMQWDFVVRTLFCAAAFAAIYYFLRLFHSRTWSIVGLLAAPIVMLWSLDMPAADAFPQVFFFAAAFICLVRKKPAWFALVFVVALMNRETIAALVLPFVITFWPAMPKRRLAAWTALLVASTVVWKFYLAPTYLPGGRGGVVDLQFVANLKSLRDLRHVLNPFAKNPFTILGYTYLLVPWAWRDLPDFGKMLCLCFVPYGVLMLIVARLAETRVYMEWTPLATLVVVAALMRSVRESDAGTDQRSYRNSTSE